MKKLRVAIGGGPSNSNDLEVEIRSLGQVCSTFHIKQLKKNYVQDIIKTIAKYLN